MRRALAVLLGLLLLSGPSSSQQVPNPMAKDAGNATLPEALTNFGYGQQLAASVTCTTASGSPAVTGCNATTGLKAGMAVKGPGIPTGATIQGGITATGFTLSANATASGTGLITIRHHPYWSDDGGEPPIWRYPGRIFVGNAVGQPGQRFALPYWTFCPDGPACANWGARDSDLAVMSSRGAMAITGMSRTSDAADIAGPISTIGLSGFLVSDVAGRGGHAEYLDVQHDAAADGQFAFGSEIALKNKAGNYISGAYDYQPGVYGIRLSAGGDPSYGGPAVNPVNTAIDIASIVGTGVNTFNRGILFRQASLTGTNGYTGCCGVALEMAKGHSIAWAVPSATGTPTVWALAITSMIDDAAGQIQLYAENQQLSFLGNNGTSKIFQIANVPAAVNRLRVTDSITSAAPELAAVSESDANVSMALKPQGTGTVNPAVGLKLPNYTVATLPACNAGYTYVMAAVSDASAPAYNATVAGGGAVKVPVMCDGAAWKAH